MDKVEGARKKGRQYVLFVVFFLGGAFLLINLISHKLYMLASLLILIVSFFPFMIRFERRPLAARELVMISILAAVTALSRIPFASIPSVQPTTFVIIMTGLVFGSETGFVVGNVGAFISNIFLGQGPWTPWQMYAWGLIGLCSGTLKNSKAMKSPTILAIFGFLTGILFGWIMNLWIVVGILQTITWGEFITLYITSFYFDLAHGITNAFLLLVFSKSWRKRLGRFQQKYGLLDGKDI